MSVNVRNVIKEWFLMMSSRVVCQIKQKLLDIRNALRVILTIINTPINVKNVQWVSSSTLTIWLAKADITSLSVLHRGHYIRRRLFHANLALRRLLNTILTITTALLVPQPNPTTIPKLWYVKPVYRVMLTTLSQKLVSLRQSHFSTLTRLS